MPMSENASASPTLMDAAWANSTRSVSWRGAALVIAGSLLITVAARVQIPLWPVPVTLQTFAVLLIGMVYGWRLGGVTVLTYLIQGAIGLPVFASGGGIHQFIGPTGGYLVGFLAAAATVGWLAERGWDKSVLPVLGAMLIGSAVIYAFGATWLATLVGFEQAIRLGVLPFLLGDLLKALLAMAILPTAWRLVSAPR